MIHSIKLKDEFCPTDAKQDAHQITDAFRLHLLKFTLGDLSYVFFIFIYALL